MMVSHSASMVERSLQRRIRRLAGLLIAMSLVPGIALAVSSDTWRLLPPNIQWSAYLLSVVLLIAAWSLLSQEGACPDGEDLGSAELLEGRKAGPISGPAEAPIMQRQP
jgi:hypothetical protein